MNTHSKVISKNRDYSATPVWLPLGDAVVIFGNGTEVWTSPAPAVYVTTDGEKVESKVLYIADSTSASFDFLDTRDPDFVGLLGPHENLGDPAWSEAVALHQNRRRLEDSRQTRVADRLEVAADRIAELGPGVAAWSTLGGIALSGAEIAVIPKAKALFEEVTFEPLRAAERIAEGRVLFPFARPLR